MTLRLAALLALAACAQPPEPPDSRVAALAAAPAACGAPAYAWRSDPTLGDLVEWREREDLRFTPEAIVGLLSLVGIQPEPRPARSTRSYLIRYRTQDRGQPVEATGFVTIPEPLLDEEPKYPLLAWLHGSSGYHDGCAPSAAIGDPIAASMLASLGYVVVAPDYLGLNGFGAPSGRLHPALVGEPTAIASLDSMRAARRLLATTDLGVAVAAPSALVGGSQGGHAALFAARYAPYYAPEEDIRAVVASVPPIDFAGEAERAATQLVDGTDNLARALAVMAEWYGVPLVEALREPHATELPRRLRESCRPRLEGPLEEIFTASFLAEARRGFPEDSGRFGCILRANSLTATTVAAIGEPIPTLVTFGELDPLVHTPLERHAFERLCDQGLPLEYLECEGLQHSDGAVASFPEQLAFLGARMKGEAWPAARICVRNGPVRCLGTP